MKRKKKVSWLITLVLIFFLGVLGPSLAQEKKGVPPPLLLIKLKVFEGNREGKVEPIKTVTSSFWRYTVSASIKAEETTEKEENELRRVFNLKGVQLLAEANLSWTKTGTKDFHIFRLDSKEYAIITTLLRLGPQDRATCRVEVLEQDNERKASLLDSELALDKNSITAFGFEDKSGKPYFLSLKILAISPSSGRMVVPFEGLESNIPGQAGGMAGGVSSLTGEQDLSQDVIRAMGDIKPPRLIKRVDPVYPEEARKKGIEGVVILEVQTDKFGRVARIKVLKSVPELDQAAIEAVKQWVYEPVIVNGKPKGIIFTVTVSFRLKNEEEGIKKLSF
ncbi:MAG: energy transducer TonB [Candidatus Aminicenantes bacterium]|nr:energy transducer TonB [Candidatus Aminicenantes bacterium]